MVDILSTLKNGESIPHSEGDASFSRLPSPTEVIYRRAFRVNGIASHESTTVSCSDIRSVGISHECSPNLQDYRWSCHLPFNAFLPIMTGATTPISKGIMTSTYLRSDRGEGSVKVDMLSAFILRLKTEAFCLTFCKIAM